MSEKTYKVFQRKLIETRLEEALCPNCNTEMEFIKALYFDPDKMMLAGFEHMCPCCATVSVLPLKYPRKIEKYSTDGKVVEYMNYDGSDIDERGIVVCTKIQ